MYEVYYKCFYRDQWYWDSNHDSPDYAVSRAAGVSQSTGRAVAVTINGSPVWTAPQTRMVGVGVPVMAGAQPYLD
jgi:ketopantoate hydroxymethyltransferase